MLLFSVASSADGKFKFLGSFDNVESNDTGHCYGISILVWELDDMKTIGLLNVDMGLCGDSPCSIFVGTIANEKITFETSAPIYDELYFFEGHISKTKLSGSLNGVNTTLISNSFKQRYKNTQEWCSAWARVPRCHGVKEYCQ